MTLELFDAPPTWQEPLAPGAVVLRSFAVAQDARILAALEDVVAQAPFSHMQTPGGFRMSVAMSNCGCLGWVSDKRGYRYATTNPQTGKPWPKMPEIFAQLAADAAQQAGYSGFIPDACLVNRYEPGTKLSLHQDKNERDFAAPIVSVSLGLPATFLFGGLRRTEPARRVALTHGDVVVWGGPARLRYHGVLPLKWDQHPATGACRFNLTLRKAA